jgi:hypothetical protein
MEFLLSHWIFWIVGAGLLWIGDRSIDEISQIGAISLGGLCLLWGFICAPSEWQLMTTLVGVGGLWLMAQRS